MGAVNVIKRRATAYTVTRPGTPTIVDGLSTPGTPVSVEVQAYAQQMSSKDMRNLPPGQNAGEWINIWSETEMNLQDQFPFRGVQYTVQRVALWEDGPFYIMNANHTFDTV